MTILEALVKLRDDIKLWSINNFNKKLNKNLGSEESGKFLITDENGEITTADITATAAELNIMDGVTATTTEINILNGITTTTTELNYVGGVTSAIQTQLDGKAALSHNHATSDITSGTLSSDRLPIIPIDKGGTGAADVATARANLGIGLYWENFLIEGTKSSGDSALNVEINLVLLCNKWFHETTSILLDTFKAGFIERVPAYFKVPASGFIGTSPVTFVFHTGTTIYVRTASLVDVGAGFNYSIDDMNISSLDGVTYHTCKVL